MAAAFADGVGKARLGATELRDQPAVGFGFFERRQIFALKVLDQGDFEHFGIGKRADNDRHLMEPDALRGAPAALAGDQFEGGVVFGDRAHQQRLQYALFTDRLGQRVEFGLGEAAARLQCPGPDQLDRNAALSARVQCRIGLGLAKQGSEAATERAALGAFAHYGGPGAARRSSSAASWI